MAPGLALSRSIVIVIRVMFVSTVSSVSILQLGVLLSLPGPGPGGQFGAEPGLTWAVWTNQKPVSRSRDLS